MKLQIKSASPDGMTVVYETFLMTWENLKDFVDIMAVVESGRMKKLLEERTQVE